MPDMSMQKAALIYTVGNSYRHAMSVFPVNPQTKAPLTDHGFYDASPDEGTVRDMWDQYPDANIGLPTGKINGILVLDFDNVEEEGVFASESIRALEQKYGELPETWQAITGRGGYHYFYKYPADRVIGCSVGELAPHVDVRGAGGYVVVAPSMHANGHRYEWEAAHVPSDIPLADLPEVWLKAIEDTHTKAKNAGNGSPFELPDHIEEGKRNDTLFRYACSLRARRVRASDIMKALTEANHDRCDVPLKEDELVKIFDQAMNYDPGSGRDPATVHEEERPEGSVRPSDFSDIGNATVLERISGATMRWTASLGWLVWNGTIWERNDQLARCYARMLTDFMLDEARQACKDSLTIENSKIDVPAEEKAFLKHAERSRSVRSIDAILSVAQTTLYANAQTFDANPFDLNTPAGIVDLRTGEIRLHDPLSYCSKITAARPSREGGTRWHEFLNLITEGDADLITYLQYVAGMCAIGTVFHEGVIIANGGGANGKSTFFNALSLVMGDYATGIDVTVLTTDRQNKRFGLSPLRGARLVTCGELEEGQRMSVQTLKRVASTDPITIEEKHKNPETILPSHHICLFTNHLPKIGSTDQGTWRRITVVPFNATMPTGAKRIPNYAKHLVEEEGGAILQWIIDGAVMFHKNGDKLIESETAEKAKAIYQEREDWLKNFIDECCIVDSNATVRCGVLFDAYKQYADDCGDYRRRKADFAAALENAGYKQFSPGKNQMWWRGLKLNPAYTYGSTTSAGANSAYFDA